MKPLLFSLGAILCFASMSFADDKVGKIEFIGIVQEMPENGFVGTWKVSEKTISVTADTKIKEDDGKMKVGAKVEVEGMMEADGTVLAREIETEN